MFLMLLEIVLEAVSTPLDRLIGRQPQLKRSRGVLRHQLLHGPIWARVGCVLAVAVGSTFVAVALLIGSLLLLTALLRALSNIV